MTRPLAAFVLLVALVLGGSPAARANVPPPQPDPCIREAEGAACKPRVGPPGRCTWVTSEQRAAMELHDKPRCEDRGGKYRDCLMCVSDIYRGDGAERRKRIASLIAAEDLQAAEMLIQYTQAILETCDAELGALWLRLARASEAAQRSGANLHYSLAVECDPGRYSTYIELAKSASNTRAEWWAVRALLSLSRRLANDEAPAEVWQRFGAEIATDPRLDRLRMHKDGPKVRERFQRGLALASAPPGAPFHCVPEAPAHVEASPVAKEAGHYRDACVPAAGATRCPSWFFKVRGEKRPHGTRGCTAP